LKGVVEEQERRKKRKGSEGTKEERKRIRNQPSLKTEKATFNGVPVKTHKHGNAVLSSRGAEGTVGGDGDGRDVTGVTKVVRAELALGELPDLRR
jgi:hypothetical protein